MLVVAVDGPVEPRCSTGDDHFVKAGFAIDDVVAVQRIKDVVRVIAHQDIVKFGAIGILNQRRRVNIKIVECSQIIQCLANR